MGTDYSYCIYSVFVRRHSLFVLNRRVSDFCDTSQRDDQYLYLAYSANTQVVGTRLSIRATAATAVALCKRSDGEVESIVCVKFCERKP